MSLIVDGGVSSETSVLSRVEERIAGEVVNLSAVFASTVPRSASSVMRVSSSSDRRQYKRGGSAIEKLTQS